jgi:hypothetical protein
MCGEQPEHRDHCAVRRHGHAGCRARADAAVGELKLNGHAIGTVDPNSHCGGEDVIGVGRDRRGVDRRRRRRANA